MLSTHRRACTVDPAEKRPVSLSERKKGGEGGRLAAPLFQGLKHKIRPRGSIEYEESFAWRFIRSNELTQGKS